MSQILEAARAAILRADPKLSETDQEFMHQAILLASAMIGANEDEIAAELGYEPEFVDIVGSRLRNSEVWTGDSLSETHDKAWSDKKTGGIAFMMDAAVAGGAMTVQARDGDQISYSLTPAGRQRVERMGLTK